MVTPEYRCMELTTTLLRYLGVWPRWKQMEKPLEKVYLCCSIFIVVDLCVHLGVLTFGFVTSGKSWTTRSLPLEEFIVYATGVVVLIKVIMLIWIQKEIQEVVDYINGSLNRRRIVSAEDRKEILSCVRHERILVSMYAGAAAGLFVIYFGASVIKMIRDSWKDNYQTKLPMTYHVTINDGRIFFVVLVHQLIVMVINGEAGTLADALFSCLLYYICGHLRIVKTRFLKRDDVIEKSAVEYHNEIIRLIARVENIFKKFLLFLFTVTSFLICLALLQVSQAEDSITYEKTCIYLGIKLSQLFLYCWYGQEIIQRTSELSFACYSTKWYNHLGRSNFKNFRFVLMRSQKPIRMRTEGFFYISLETLKSVINASYSFYTVFSSLRK